MTINTKNYPDVAQKASDFGFSCPSGLSILPSNFESATEASELHQVPEAATLKTLFRNNGIPLDELVPEQTRLPYVHNNSFEWLAPTIFITSSYISNNYDLLSLAISVLAEYAKDFLKGMGNSKEVSINIVVETDGEGSYKEISYKGSVEGLSELPEVIRNASKD